VDLTAARGGRTASGPNVLAPRAQDRDDRRVFGDAPELRGGWSRTLVARARRQTGAGPSSSGRTETVNGQCSSVYGQDSDAGCGTHGGKHLHRCSDRGLQPTSRNVARFTLLTGTTARISATGLMASRD